MSSSYRKRPASYSSDEPSGKRSKSPKGIPPPVTFDNAHVPAGNDVYCWVCHLQGVRLFCKRCPKSFHPNCVMMGDGQSYSDYNCYECLNLMASRDSNYGFKVLHMFSVAEICEIIKYLIRHLEVYAVFDVMPFRMDPGFSPEDEAKIKRMPPTKPWEEIINLVENDGYDSLDKFRLDFFGLIHQRVVLNRERYLPHAEAVQRKFDKEISVLRLCPDCYIRANRMSDDSVVSNKDQPDNYFVGVCRLPHALVYAKYKNYPFWPAKVLHQYTGKSVKVRFFGDHTMSSCEFKNTTLLTQTPPGGNNKKQNASFTTSMAELNQHLMELKKVLGGPIKFAPPSKSYSNAKAAVLLKEQMPQVVELLPQIDFNENAFVMKRGSPLGPPEPMVPFLGEPVKFSVEELIATREGMIMKTMNTISNGKDNTARTKPPGSTQLPPSSSKRKSGKNRGTPKRSSSSLSQNTKEPVPTAQNAQPAPGPTSVTPITPASCNISEENIIDLPRRGSKDKHGKRDGSHGGVRGSPRPIHVSVLDLKNKDEDSKPPKRDKLRLRPREKEGKKRGQEGKGTDDEDSSEGSASSDSEDSGDEDYKHKSSDEEEEEGRGGNSDVDSMASNRKEKGPGKADKSENEESSSDEEEEKNGAPRKTRNRKMVIESDDEPMDFPEPARESSDSSSESEEEISKEQVVKERKMSEKSGSTEKEEKSSSSSSSSSSSGSSESEDEGEKEQPEKEKVEEKQEETENKPEEEENHVDEDEEEGNLEIDEKEDEEPPSEEKVEPTVPPLRLTISPTKPPSVATSPEPVKGTAKKKRKTAGNQRTTKSSKLALSPKARRHDKVSPTLAAKRKSDLMKVLKRLQNTDAVLSRSPPAQKESSGVTKATMPDGLVIKAVGSVKKIISTVGQVVKVVDKSSTGLANHKVDDNENHINEGVSVRKVIMTKHGLKKSAPTTLPEVLRPLAAKKTALAKQARSASGPARGQSPHTNGPPSAPPALLPIGGSSPSSLTGTSSDGPSPAVSLAKAIVSGTAVPNSREGVFQIGSTVLSGPEGSVSLPPVPESPPHTIIDNQAAENELAKRKDLEFRRIITTSEEQTVVRLNLTPASCTVEKILEASRQPSSRVSIVRSNKNKNEAGVTRDVGSSTAASSPSRNGSVDGFDGDGVEGDPLDTSQCVPHPALRNLVPGTIIRRAVGKNNGKNVGKNQQGSKRKRASVPYNPLEPQVVLEEEGPTEDPLADDEQEDLIEDLDMDIKPDIEELDSMADTVEVSITPSSGPSQTKSAEMQLVRKKSASQMPPLAPVVQLPATTVSIAASTKPAIIQVRDFGQPGGPTVVGAQPVNLSILGAVGQTVAMRSQNTSPLRPNSRGAAVMSLPLVPKDIDGLLSRLMQFTNSEVSAYVKDQISRLEQVQQTRESTMNTQVRQMRATIEALTKENNQLHAEVSFLKNRVAEMEGRGVELTESTPTSTSAQVSIHGDGNEPEVGQQATPAAPSVLDLKASEGPEMASVGVGTDDSGDIGGPSSSEVNIFPKMMSGGTVGIIPPPCEPPSPCSSEPRDLVIHEEEDNYSDQAMPTAVELSSRSSATPPPAPRVFYMQQQPAMYGPPACTSAAGSVIQTLTTPSGTKLTVSRASTPGASTSIPAAVLPTGHSSDGEKRKKRRRCGSCPGCQVARDCGECRACLNPRRHQVCRLRKCQALQRGKKKPHQPPPPPYTRPAVTLHHRPITTSHSHHHPMQMYPVSSSASHPPPPPLSHSAPTYHPPPVCQSSMPPRMPLQIMDPTPATLANLAAASGGAMPGGMHMGPARYPPPPPPPPGVPYTSGFSIQSSIGGPRISLGMSVPPPPLMHPSSHAGMNMVRPMGFYTR